MTGPDWVNGDPASLRRWRDQQPEVLAPEMPLGMREQALPPVGAFQGGILFIPAAAVSDRMIVHFHGGGFVVGSPRTHRVVAAWIAEVAGCPVLLAGYRLAPEHVVPAQAQDAAAALRLACEWFLGAVTLSGDSAGALVALWGHAASTPAVRDRITSALLVYGVYGLMPTQQPAEVDESQGLGPRSIRSMYARVDPMGAIGRSPLLSPLLPEASLPAEVRVIGAALDPLLPDSRALVAAHPQVCRLILAEGMGHGFLSAQTPTRATLDLLARAVGPALF